MRKLVIPVVALVVAAVAIVLVLVLRREVPAPAAAGPAESSRAGAPSGGAAAAAGAPRDAAAASPRAPATVRRLDPETRKRLGEQIAAARARARASSPGGSATEEYLKLEAIAVPVREAMFEAVPILADCYEDRAAGARTAVARMTLTSDPELGTVIDTEAIQDANARPLDPGLEACLRDTIDTLGLPPLDSVGGKLQLQYSFRFDD